MKDNSQHLSLTRRLAQAKRLLALASDELTRQRLAALIEDLSCRLAGQKDRGESDREPSSHANA